MTIELVVQKKIQIEDCLQAILYTNGVVEIIWDTSISIVEREHMMKAVAAIGELGAGKKMPCLYTAHEFLNISRDGGAYASSEEGLKYTLGNAFIEDNLAKKILFFLYMKVNQPKAPTKGFSNREDAVNWLESLVR